MSWNNGYERKRFEEKLRKQGEEYKRQGMNDAQIEEIESLDWEIFKSDRRFFSHTQPLDYDDDFENEARNPLLIHFVVSLSDGMTHDYTDKTWWISEIEDEKIVYASFASSFLSAQMASNIFFAIRSSFQSPTMRISQ